MKIYKVEHIYMAQGDTPDITVIGHFSQFPTIDDLLELDAEDYATKVEYIKLLEGGVGSLTIYQTSYSMEILELSEIEIIENQLTQHPDVL